jgi:DNA ligase-1
MYKSPMIFKLDSTGGIRSWRYEVDANKYRTIAGGHGRKDVASGWTTCTGKQGRSDDQQATFEANAAMDQKLKREYRQTEAELTAVPKGVMLAKSYDADKITFPVFCQPKLDGIRALISANGAFSREFQPHLNVDHILQALAPLFEASPELVLDGELYNHDFKDDFSTTSTTSPTTR